jgi:hypothetical protein
VPIINMKKLNQFSATLIICFGLFGLLALSTLIKGQFSIKDVGSGGVIIGFLYLFLGLLLCIPKDGRKVGKALLLSGGILFLIGFSICSNSF